jgi:superfamily II RNA helicase
MNLWLFRRTKKKDIYVIYTAKRPVPLEHYLYVNTSREMYKIVDANGEFIGQGLVPNIYFETSRIKNTSQV